ncbi:hypothetical protein ASE00_00675 [Sphingomonas sp. Root710]|uniref:VOC family protein n=1 Tax=Sphingomonas sp. Root710 TaxID=1736594 RepID=UPI0006F5ECD9|nr:VOC family protein [Sphingomonas sp. Root710]KRB85355.1 hypothetical protein ASE00_00675 [Sphingomonas sp. Root710]
MKSDSTLTVPESPHLDARLCEIVFTSPDVERLGAFYQEALGYSGAISAGVWTGELSARRLSIREGAANSVDRAIFAVADEAQFRSLRERLDAARTPFESAASSLTFSDPDGNRMSFTLPDGPIAPRAEPMLPARLQHVVYASDQVPAMVAFYRDVIGFAPIDIVRDDTQDLTSVFLRCGPEHHSLAIFRAPRRRLDHICYDVDDWNQIRDWADRFAGRHIPIRWGPGRHGPGNNLFFFINDPDGNWLEFSAELERVEVPRAAGQWVHEERTLNSWGPAILRS